MLKISKMADYAVVILSSLATDIECSRSAGQIALETSLPEPTASKVLKILAREGLVNSTRGISGGYKLAKPIEDVTMKDIITAVDGPIAITSCVESEKEVGCNIIGSCGVKGRWTAINHAITNLLHDITLEDMLVQTSLTCCGSISKEKENTHGCY